MQTIAIFYDAYRDLSARKLFWVTLILSGVVVLLFGILMGVRGNEIVVLKWHYNTMPFSAQSVYLWVFSQFVIGIWLTWVAIALALISTAGIFPDLLASGTIDLYLAKPIGRFRFFITKYATGLLFVGLQLAVFTIGSFLVLGVRAGLWKASLFLAIPLVLCVFSYLYSACVLFGVWMRSTIGALLLTLLVWVLCSGLFWTDQVIFGIILQNEQMVSRGYSHAAPDNGLISFEHTLQGIMAPLPKIVPTSRLLDRWLITKSDTGEMFGSDDDERTRSMLSDTERAEAKSRATGGDPYYTIGTSLAFEVVIFGLSAWIFCRRDY